MPPLNMIKILGHLKFLSHGLKLPISDSYENPPDMKQFNRSMQENNASVAVPKLIPPMFLPQSPINKYHVDACDEIGKKFKDFHDKMLDAIKFGHTMWKLQAKFQNLNIMAVSAIGSPGCLKGPSLESLIKNAPMCAAMMGNEAKWRDAVAKGVAKCFKDWQDKVTVPGLPWYPAFAAFPGPQAPPMPNVPMPLITCISPMMSKIVNPEELKKAMVDALDSGLKDKDPDKQYEALFDAIATVTALAFLMWLPSQQVMLVLGRGPVPIYAPPYVPVGPVVGGQNIAAPGHLAA